MPSKETLKPIYLTQDELNFLEMAVEYWQDKEELINPSIDYVVNPTELLERFHNLMNKDDELWKIVQKDHPKSTDQERKQIFLDWLYPKPINKRNY